MDSSLQGPFVELRPYEEHEKDIFFARRHEAVIVENKLLSNPLLVVTAPSGAGKTSLVKAAVIPALRDLDASVVFFDEWAQPPVPTIRQRVAEGFVVEEPKGLSLLELCKAAAQQRDRPLVIILDQFEQFFIRHDEDGDALGREIGELARAPIDAHVVILLRQEYLARLDAFEAHLLTVAQVSHRLAPLTQEQSEEAIREPLRLFGYDVNADLLARLVEDLRNSRPSAGLAAETASPGDLSLPFLQIVCARLYDETCARAEKQIPNALYDELGGRDRIVEAYVDEVVAKLSPSERLDAARVLHLLAPRAGVKMTYPVEELGALCGLTQKRVDRVLEHLQQNRIVRMRDAGSVAELFHDAFTHVLRGFIDGEISREEEAKKHRLQVATLRRVRIARYKRAGIAIAVAAAVFLGAVFSVMREPASVRKALRRGLETSDCGLVRQSVSKLWQKAESDSNGFLGRLLWGSREEILDDLLGELSKQPEAAGRCAEPARFSGMVVGEYGLAVRYNPESETPLQGIALQNIWKRLVGRLWEEKRVSIPPGISLIPDDRIPAGIYELRLHGKTIFRRRIPTRGRIGTLAWSGLGKAAADLELVFAKAVMQRRSVAVLNEETFFAGLAPAWSAPIWPVIGDRHSLDIKVTPGVEVEMALDMFETLAGHPRLYATASVTQDLTKGLIGELYRTAPCLVYAALDHVGCTQAAADPERPDEGAPRSSYCLSEAFGDLVSIVHPALLEATSQGRSTGALTRILDRLADIPRGERSFVSRPLPQSLAERSAPLQPEDKPINLYAVAHWVEQDDGAAQPPDTIVLSRSRQPSWGCPGPEDSDYMGELSDNWSQISQLTTLEVPVHVTLDSLLVDELVVGSQLKPEVLDGLYGLRRELDKMFGIYIPVVRFEAGTGNRRRYRIELPGVRPVEGRPRGAALPDLLKKLKKTLSARRTAIVTVDHTIDPFRFQALERMHLYGWFESRFSRNDVKLLLRGVLARAGGSAADAPAATIRYAFPWLLGSLVFWAPLCPPTDGDCLVDHLVATQAARLGKLPEQEVPEAVADRIKDGIDALAQDAPERASEAFAAGRELNAEAARVAFLRAYADQAEEMVRKRAESLCKVPDLDSKSSWGSDVQRERSEIEDALDLARTPEEAAHLRLCALMHRLPTGDGVRDARAITAFIDTHRKDEHFWIPEEAYWLGYRLLVAGATSEAELTQAQDMLGGVLRNSPSDVRGSALNRLRRACDKSDDSCAWMLADLDLDVNARDMLQWVAELRGLRTAGTEPHLAQIGSLLARVPASLEKISEPEERAYGRKVYELIRLQVAADVASRREEGMAELWSEVAEWREGLQSLGPMASRAEVPDRKKEDLLIEAGKLAMDVLYGQGRLQEAGDLLAELKETYPASDWGYYEIMQHFQTGHMPEALKLADQELAENGWQDINYLFVSALAHLVVGDQDAEKRVGQLLMDFKHRYRDYVRLMLVWRLVLLGESQRALQLLETRVLEIPRKEDTARKVASGDLDPWRDRWMRYYLDALSGAPPQAVVTQRRQLVESLRDREAFTRAEDGLWTRGVQGFKAFRCEAFFYDALLQSITGDADTREDRYRAGLETVVETRCFDTYEYHMANWLMQQPMPGREPRTAQSRAGSGNGEPVQQSALRR